MGWSNYIIIPEWKVLVEVPREIDDLGEYIYTALENVIDEENTDNRTYLEGENIIDMSDVQINNITIRDLVELYKSYDIVQSLAGISYDRFFLFWLKKRDIEFSIESEYMVKEKEYEKQGYQIIRRK